MYGAVVNHRSGDLAAPTPHGIARSYDRSSNQGDYIALAFQPLTRQLEADTEADF